MAGSNALIEPRTRLTMHIAFRTDASLQIGTGHVMRCLTLAHALRERGAQCSFICREHPAHLIDLIRKRGFFVHALRCNQDWIHKENIPSHAGWLGADWQADAEESKAGAGEMTIDWLIVDHYGLDSRWENAMRAYCHYIMVVDDLADRMHDCDLLLDQNLGRDVKDYDALLVGEAKTLIGPQYALLRPEFAALRIQSLARRQSNPQLRRLLIAMGGVDKDNASCEVLTALKTCTLSADLRVTVVMGPNAPWLTQVQAQARQMPWPTEVLVGVDNMAQLMAECDLAIGAAGGTAWERCSLGLPSLVLALAKNQWPGAFALQKAGAAVAIKTQQQITSFLKQLQAADSTKELLAKLSQAAAAVTDGEGCRRTVEHLLGGASA
jgi:UDP-2,4-diacetamido-2,4,6-trideoxy-beta-L-altropyranose hydrolase